MAYDPAATRWGMDDRFLVGVDIGTGSTKSILMRTDGVLAAEAVAKYPMHRPRFGWAENDPDDWVRAVEKTVRAAVDMAGVSREQVVGLSVVAVRDPVVLLDTRGEVLTPCISWMDRRTQEITRELCLRFGKQELIELTGVVPIPGLSLPNLIWTRRNLPEVWQQVAHIMFVKDYVFYRLTGKIGTDISTPSRSILNDLRQNCWSPYICEAAGIDIDLLSPISYRPWEVFDTLSEATADRLGLLAGTPLAAGGGDDQSAALGAGVIKAGDLCMGTGTASDWRCVMEQPTPDRAGRADVAPHLVPDCYLLANTISSTGSSTRWFRDVFGEDARAREAITGENAYTQLFALAEDVELGSNGLFYYPYLEGARAPRFNDDATGVFFGIVSSHTRVHFIRSILEGVAFQYVPNLAMLHGMGFAEGSIAMVDGETRSALWTQIKADVLGREIHVPRIIQSAAVGSCVLAGLAANVFADVDTAVTAMVHQDRLYVPDEERHERYTHIRHTYEHVYDCLALAYASVRESQISSSEGATRQPRPVQDMEKEL